MKEDTFVFFDIDGTLYMPKCGIPDSTRDAIAQLKANGHHPVVCTGRTKIMILPRVLELGFDGIIAGAGSYVEWKGEPVYQEVLSAEDAANLVRTFRRFGFAAFPEAPGKLYYDPVTCKDPIADISRIFSIQNPDIIFPYEEGCADVTKVSGIMTKDSDVKGFTETLQGRFRIIDHFHVLLETIPEHVSKAKGIERLLAFLGADPEKTYAYGDSFNDYEMLMAVKYGVCMGNGDPKLLERILLHADRLEHDGISKSLRGFGLI